MNPAQRVQADSELTGPAGDHARAGHQAVMPDRTLAGNGVKHSPHIPKNVAFLLLEVAKTSSMASAAEVDAFACWTLKSNSSME